ncbi:MAG: nucleotide exchange factor GrpE [Oscillospiraceae bacterium]|nr:nucleotide exchange factor GrpE [Oscillospiraceae bacterium]
MNENLEEIKESEITGESAEPEEEIEKDGETSELPEEKRKEYDALYDKYLRVAAEYENFRKRTAKEKEGIYSEAVIDVLNNILPISDNMERALQFSDSEKVLEGMKMIYQQFTDSLARLGVEEIKAEGEKFNPEVHNAVFHEEDGSQPENTVTEVLQKGYARGDKIIRPAMVRVVN